MFGLKGSGMETENDNGINTFSKQNKCNITIKLSLIV